MDPLSPGKGRQPRMRVREPGLPVRFPDSRFLSPSCYTWVMDDFPCCSGGQHVDSPFTGVDLPWEADKDGVTVPADMIRNELTPTTSEPEQP